VGGNRVDGVAANLALLLGGVGLLMFVAAAAGANRMHIWILALVTVAIVGILGLAIRNARRQLHH